MLAFIATPTLVAIFAFVCVAVWAALSATVRSCCGLIYYRSKRTVSHMREQGVRRSRNRRTR